MALQLLPEGRSLVSPGGATGSIPVKSEEKKCFLPRGMGLQTVPVVALAAMESGVSSHSIPAEDLDTQLL